MQKNEIPKQDDFDKCKNEIDLISKKLENYWNIINEVNEPSVLNNEIFEKIAEIASTQIIVGDNSIPEH